MANISLSEDFSMIITRKGNGILFGDNMYGQLGKGHRINVNSAQILEKFKNKISTKIISTMKLEKELWLSMFWHDKVKELHFVRFSHKIYVQFLDYSNKPNI